MSLVQTTNHQNSKKVETVYTSTDVSKRMPIQKFRLFALLQLLLLLLLVTIYLVTCFLVLKADKPSSIRVKEQRTIYAEDQRTSFTFKVSRSFYKENSTTAVVVLIRIDININHLGIKSHKTVYEVYDIFIPINIKTYILEHFLLDGDSNSISTTQLSVKLKNTT